MNYTNLSDEELIERLRTGENDIADYIMEKYKPLVRKKTNAMYLIGGETEDLIQEGMIGLFKAVRDYDAEKNTSFFSFADLLKYMDWQKDNRLFLLLLPLVIIGEEEVSCATKIISSALEEIFDKSLCNQFAKCIVYGLMEE